MSIDSRIEYPATMSEAFYIHIIEDRKSLEAAIRLLTCKFHFDGLLVAGDLLDEIKAIEYE